MGKTQQSPIYLLLELINVNLFYGKKRSPLAKKLCFVTEGRKSFAMCFCNYFELFSNFQTFWKIWTITKESWDIFKMRCYLPGSMAQWNSVQRREI